MYHRRGRRRSHHVDSSTTTDKLNYKRPFAPVPARDRLLIYRKTHAFRNADAIMQTLSQSKRIFMVDLLKCNEKLSVRRVMQVFRLDAGLRIWRSLLVDYFSSERGNNKKGMADWVLCEPFVAQKISCGNFGEANRCASPDEGASNPAKV